ncbi:nuclear protein es2 [Cystoisospora suis]|uniref:Nuclear protein es2 n=1 Tax=Cystoisospora suis TaxID=483139 RepID=A0A2C6L1I3_9APIC|nr:nuclear protein es2 [Cystoisospora suis]
MTSGQTSPSLEKNSPSSSIRSYPRGRIPVPPPLYKKVVGEPPPSLLPSSSSSSSSLVSQGPNAVSSVKKDAKDPSAADGSVVAAGERGGRENLTSSSLASRLKLNSCQLSLLHAKKAFPIPSSLPSISLDQRNYTQALCHIITRDYYPDLPLLQLLTQLLEAERRKDLYTAEVLLERIREVTPASILNRQGTGSTRHEREDYDDIANGRHFVFSSSSYPSSDSCLRRTSFSPSVPHTPIHREETSSSAFLRKARPVEVKQERKNERGEEEERGENLIMIESSSSDGGEEKEEKRRERKRTRRRERTTEKSGREDDHEAGKEEEDGKAEEEEEKEKRGVYDKSLSSRREERRHRSIDTKETAHAETSPNLVSPHRTREKSTHDEGQHVDGPPPEDLGEEEEDLSSEAERNKKEIQSSSLKRSSPYVGASSNEEDATSPSETRRERRKKSTSPPSPSPPPSPTPSLSSSSSPSLPLLSSSSSWRKSSRDLHLAVPLPNGKKGLYHRVKTELRLDPFLRRYMSEDTRSFFDIIAKEKAEKEEEQRWIGETQERHNARMVEIQKKTIQGEQAKGQLAVGFLATRNNLFYPNFDTLESHRQPYEPSRRSGEIVNVNTRYTSSEREQHHSMYSLQLEKAAQLAPTEEQRRALEEASAVVWDSKLIRERRDREEEEKLKKASEQSILIPGAVTGYTHTVDLSSQSLPVNSHHPSQQGPALPKTTSRTAISLQTSKHLSSIDQQAQVSVPTRQDGAQGEGVTPVCPPPVVTWRDLLSTPARLQAGSSSTPFLNSSIFEPCPVSQTFSSSLITHGGGGGDSSVMLSSQLLANSINLATFKMPDPLPREKALSRLQDRASSRIQEQQSRRRQQTLLYGPHGAYIRRNLHEKRAAAQAASVVLRGGKRFKSSSSSTCSLSSSISPGGGGSCSIEKRMKKMMASKDDKGDSRQCLFLSQNRGGDYNRVSEGVREICHLAGLTQSSSGGLFKRKGGSRCSSSVASSHASRSSRLSLSIPNVKVREKSKEQAGGLGAEDDLPNDARCTDGLL